MPKFNKAKILQDDTTIHCDSMNKAIALLKWADSIGLAWGSGDNPLIKIKWNEYNEFTGYTIDKNCISYTDVRESSYKIINYDDVIEKDSNA